MSSKLPIPDKEDLKSIENIRFYALYDRETRTYVVSPKGKFLWTSRANLKTAFYHHTGSYFKDLRTRFQIREFELREVKGDKKYFSELYKKKVGDF